MKYSKLLLVSFILCGCDYLPSIEINNKPKESVVVTDDTDVKNLAEVMKVMDKEDLLTIRKVYVGIQEYLSHGKRLTTTAQVLTVIKSFEEDYDYITKRYPTCSAAVKQFLYSKNYNKAKVIVETPEEVLQPVDGVVKQIVRSDVIKDIKVLADATKVALNGK